MNYFIVSFFLMLMASIALYLSTIKRSIGNAQDTIDTLGKVKKEPNFFIHSRTLIQRKTSEALIDTFDLLLRKSGCITREEKIKKLSVAVILNSIFYLPVMVYFITSDSLIKGVLYSLIILFFLLFLNVYFLKEKISQRKKEIDEQVETQIQITQMFWDTGMTLESVIKHSIDALSESAPEICEELSSALHRIEGGLDRRRALEELASYQTSKVFSSYLILMAQVSESGVSVNEALGELSSNNIDYKRIRLQEKVSKMSGKMSLVMMIFLFPALLILLAGPAMLNIAGLMGK